MIQHKSSQEISHLVCKFIHFAVVFRTLVLNDLINKLIILNEISNDLNKKINNSGNNLSLASTQHYTTAKTHSLAPPRKHSLSFFNCPPLATHTTLNGPGSFLASKAHFWIFYHFIRFFFLSISNRNRLIVEINHVTY